MKRMGLFVAVAVLALAVLGSTESRAEWVPETDKFPVMSGERVSRNMNVMPDQQGGWVLKWYDYYDVMLTRISALQEVVHLNTGLIIDVGDGGNISISENGNFIVLAKNEISGLRLQLYDLDLNPVDPPLFFERFSTNVHAYLNSSGEFLLAWATWEGYELYIRKFDRQGNPLTDPVLVSPPCPPEGYSDYCYRIRNLWVTEDGKVIVRFGMHLCEIISDSYSEAPYLRTFDMDLNPINDPVNISGMINFREPYVIGMERDGEILVYWMKSWEECVECMEIGLAGCPFCWPIRIEQWLQRLDSVGNPVGEPILFGEAELEGELNPLYGGELVGDYTRGHFYPNPAGGFIIVSVRHHTGEPFDMYVFDGAANLLEGPVTFHESTGYNYLRTVAFNRSGRKVLAIWSEPHNEFMAKIIKEINTPEGEGVNYDSEEGVSLSFDEVIGSGYTEVTLMEDGPGPPPGNFRILRPPVYYDISTTAQFSGQVRVCINYEKNMPVQVEKNIRMFHWDGHWEDVTTSIDVENNVVCGMTDSVSEFILALPVFAGSDSSSGGGCIMSATRPGDAGRYSPLNPLIYLLPLLFIYTLRKIKRPDLSYK